MQFVVRERRSRDQSVPPDELPLPEIERLGPKDNEMMQSLEVG
jgi:hypothetical protein